MNPAPLLVAAALAVAAPALAQPAPAPARAPRAVRLPPVETWRLDNGLEVALAPLPGSPVVSVQVWYRAGAVDDPEGKHGLARLFENLMFAGSRRLRPGDHRGYIERVGGTASGQVSEDVSAFRDTVPAERLELALDLEVERMRGLELAPDAVARAIEQLQAQEAQQAGSALWRAYRALSRAAFVQHPYGQAASPPPAALASIGEADVRAFYDAYYQPGNALLVVVGGVDPAAARKVIEARFAAIPRAAAPPRPAAELVEPAQSARRREEIAGADGLIMLGFHIPAATDPAVYAFQLIGQVLTGGKTSRLGRLVSGGRALDVGGQVLVRRDPGLMLFYAAAPRGSSSEPLEATIGAELAAIGARGPTGAELTRAKKQIAATVLSAAGSATGYGNQLGVAWGLTGKPDRVGGDLGDLAAVPATALRRAAAGALGPDRATVVAGRPAKGGR